MKQVILLSADGLQKEVSVGIAIRTWINPMVKPVYAVNFTELGLQDYPTSQQILRREYKFRGRRVDGKEVFEEVL